MPGELIPKGNKNKHKPSKRKPLTESNLSILWFSIAFFGNRVSNSNVLSKTRENNVRDCYLKKGGGKKGTLGNY